MAHLGKLGFLIELKCAASLSLQTVRPARARTTLGGVNTVQVGARTNRTWDVSLSDASTPAEHEIRAFVEGEHGLGPWCFVSDWASVTNVISPRGSVLDTSIAPVGTTTNGGPVALPDGTRAGRSWLLTSGATVFLPWVDGLEYVPVVPGRRVTASVYAQGQGGRMRIRFYAADGTITRTVAHSLVAGTGVERMTLSATPAVGEASALIMLDQGITRFARPALSWTDSARPWSVGEGAPMVHVSEVSSDVVLATRAHQYASAEFQIVEVG